MVRAAGEGFRALASQGVAVQPRALKMIFTIVPPVIAVLYWQGQLRGTLGTVALAPHSRITKDTELPVLYRDVQKMVVRNGSDPAPGQAADPGSIVMPRDVKQQKGPTGSRKWWILPLLSFASAVSWPPGHTARPVRK